MPRKAKEVKDIGVEIPDDAVITVVSSPKGGKAKVYVVLDKAGNPFPRPPYSEGSKASEFAKKIGGTVQERS